jgi:hypothetical protein
MKRFGSDSGKKFGQHSGSNIIFGQDSGKIFGKNSGNMKLAIEFLHKSWFDKETYNFLKTKRLPLLFQIHQNGLLILLKQLILFI